MGVIETEYSEIRELTKKILAGTIDKETATLALKGYSECGKRTDQYLKVVSMTINHGKAMTKIVNKNIISNDGAIDAGVSAIDEKIKCPAHGEALIDRDHCLDFSGESRNIDSCQQCQHFGTTRKLFRP